jgi:hypothetical protein
MASPADGRDTPGKTNGAATALSWLTFEADQVDGAMETYPSKRKRGWTPRATQSE